MNKYLRRPKSEPVVGQGRFEKFNLRENPFPSSPFVNPDSNDARSNGDIYEKNIRSDEYDTIKNNFLSVPQSDLNHLRLGYIVDTSYIGRGNGKSAFLVNLQKEINSDFGLEISDGHNKCFSLILNPEPKGMTKTFDSFVDLFAEAIFRADVIDDCLLTLRLESIISIKEDFDVEKEFSNDDELKKCLSSLEWYKSIGIEYWEITQHIRDNSYLQTTPKEFPVNRTNLFEINLVSQKDFEEYYQQLKRGKERIEFVFSDIVNLFLAAGYNGAYIFVDDFERIPDFQSERQKRDFALEIRTCLFDGLYTNTKLGFYVLFLVLHAGVPRLIQKAWDESGLENRAPLSYKSSPKNIIRFEKIDVKDAYLLVRKYLNEYRIKNTSLTDYSPFDKNAIALIAKTSENNASRILKKAYELLERATANDIDSIDKDFVNAIESGGFTEERPSSGIHDARTEDLRKKAE